MKDAPTKAADLTNSFRSLLLASLLMAALCFAVPFLVAPGAWDGAIKVSEFLTMLWIILVIVAFTKFKWRGFWFFIGAPLVGYWFYVLYSIVLACAENIKNCP